MTAGIAVQGVSHRASSYRIALATIAARYSLRVKLLSSASIALVVETTQR